MRQGKVLAALFAAVLAPAMPAQAQAEGKPFRSWLDETRAQARAAGVSEGTVAAALGNVTPSPRVLALDRRQPEFIQSFWEYVDARVTPARIERGRLMLARHAALLADVERRYGVPPRVLIALWGMESDFGGDTGDFDVVQATATLAFDGRRSSFFSEQLLALLQIIDRGDVPVGTRGSWAGAMGQMQFMPVTYRDAAVDGDGDGRRDLWRSLGDIMASAANYLVLSGWRPDEPWGHEVLLPPGFDLAMNSPGLRRPAAEWQALGLRRADGGELGAVDGGAALLLPAGVAGGPSLLIYPNFDVLMTWNRSLLYAIAVGYLADRIGGAPPFAAARPPFAEALTRTDLFEVQTLLARLGYDAGPADGILGQRTRAALHSFQQRHDLPADGYPSPGVIERLRLMASP